MSDYLRKQRFTVMIEYYGDEPISWEAVFLAVQERRSARRPTERGRRA